ncbi:MAG: hypothetical protein R8M45_02620, partial [Ghiorsea sp.]
IWWLIACFMEHPPYLATLTLKVEVTNAEQADELRMGLLALNGVAEVLVMQDEQAAYCKIDKKVADEDALRALACDFLR